MKNNVNMNVANICYNYNYCRTLRIHNHHDHIADGNAFIDNCYCVLASLKFQYF